MVHSVDIPWWFLYRKFVMFEAVMDDTSTVRFLTNILCHNPSIYISEPQERRQTADGQSITQSHTKHKYK